MIIDIENCGVIGHATIVCDGITIITGKNGSGKSTLVKSASSLISVLKDFDSNFADDIKRYIKKKVGPLYQDFLYALIDGARVYGLLNERKDYSIADEISEKMILGNKVIKGDFSFNSLRDSIGFLESLLAEFEDCRPALGQYIKQVDGNPRSRRIRGWLEEALSVIPQEIRETIEYLSRDALERDYLFESAKSLINYTFAGQIIPNGHPSNMPAIRISGDEKRVSYTHNVGVDTNVSPHGFAFNCFYIDDGNLLDQIDNNRIKKQAGINNSLSPSCYSLRDLTLVALASGVNILSTIENKGKYSLSMRLLDGVWPHSVSKRKGVTINADSGLCLANEASGAKIFIILKQLLISGKINEKTLLIFDEPENHLHPEWQNKFAEVLSTICLETRAKAICITHSPSTLLAFDVYSKTMGFRDKFKCYFGDIKERTAFFEDLTDSIETAHDKLNEPYVWMDLQDRS